MTDHNLPIARDGFNPAPYDWLGHCPQKVAAIIRSACERNEVSVRHLMLGRKTRAVTRARRDACAELRAMHWGSAEHPGGPRQGPSHARPSLPQIGLWLRLHHTTVLHGIRAHKAREETAVGRRFARLPDDSNSGIIGA